MAILYSERLRPPWSWWLLAAALAGTIGWVVWVAAGPVAATACALGALAAAAGGLVATGRTAVRVRVGADGPVLTAGPGRLDLRAVTRASALDREQSRALRGPDYDPRAFHVLRGWRARAVRLDLADARDPTPYWFVSTAAPELVVAAVARARAATSTATGAGTDTATGTG